MCVRERVCDRVRASHIPSPPPAETQRGQLLAGATRRLFSGAQANRTRSSTRIKAMLSYLDCACTRRLFSSLYAWAHLLPNEEDGASSSRLQAARLVAAGDELVLAVNDGAAAELVRLLANGASPNACTSNGVWTPLSLACKSRQPGLVSLLLCHGADPNHCSPNGGLPLAIAVHHAVADCARVLLQHGACPWTICPIHGQSAHELAKAGGYDDLDRMLAEDNRRRRRARLRRHAQVVDACCRALLVMYNEVAFRPGNRGYLLAQAEFEHVQQGLVQPCCPSSQGQTVKQLSCAARQDMESRPGGVVNQASHKGLKGL